MSEPRTAAGRALLDHLRDWSSSAEYRKTVLAIEAGAVQLFLDDKATRERLEAVVADADVRITSASGGRFGSGVSVDALLDALRPER